MHTDWGLRCRLKNCNVVVILPIRSASASRRIYCLNADQVSSHVRRYAALDLRLWISIYVKGNLCTKTGKRKTAAASTRHACYHRRRMIIRLFLGRVRHHKELEGKQRSPTECEAQASGYRCRKPRNPDFNNSRLENNQLSRQGFRRAQTDRTSWRR